MFANLLDWLEHRTGYRKLVSALLIEHIPGGAKWRYVWGSTLAFVFAIQLVTGILLMTAYSPGATTSWGSVYFIQYEMDFGWLIRGLHHFGSQTMVVLLGLHMLQVVIAGAHLPPREINWWLGLALMGVVLALSLTGYLLPWDQKGYWATQVATNIAGNLPVVGPWIAKIIVGGSEYGHHTVTRFYALHVGILPPLLIVLVIAHLTVFRRHGVTTPPNAKGGGWFWPDQAFRDLLVSLVIFGIMLTLVFMGHGHKIESAESDADQGWYERLAHMGRDGAGANLDAPADPSRPYPARPEWYFLFLFQLLKYFDGDLELIGTVVIPNGVGVLLALLPLFGYGSMRRFGHILGVLVVTALLAGVGALTCLALADDMVYPQARWLMVQTGTRVIPGVGGVLLLVLGLVWLAGTRGARKPLFFLGSLLLTALLAGTGSLLYFSLRADALADQVWKDGMRGKTPPKEDAEYLAFIKDIVDGKKEYFPAQLRELLDKLISAQDREYLAKNLKFREEQHQAETAAARAVALAGAGVPAEGPTQLLRRDPVTRGNALFGRHCATCHTHDKDFPSDKPSASNLKGFGTKEWIHRLLLNPGHEDFFGRTNLNGMAEFIDNTFPNLRESPEPELLQIAEWLALSPRETHPDRNKQEFKHGFELFKKRECLSCHTYEGQGGTRRNRGPDFTGYADADWLRLMLMAPNDSRRYGLKNTMPAFRDLEGVTAEVTRRELEVRKHQLLRDELQARTLAEDDPTAKKFHTQAETSGRVMQLTDVERELIIRYLLNDPRVVFGGEQISGPPLSDASQKRTPRSDASAKRR